MTLQKVYKDYFIAFLDFIQRAGIHLRTPREPYSGSFQKIDSWQSQAVESAISLRLHKVRVDVTLKGERANDQFEELKKDQAEIEQLVGQALNWNNTPPSERQIIAVLEKADPRVTSDWPRQHAWLAARLVAFRLAFGPRIEAWHP